MKPPYSKDEMIDLVMEFKGKDYPDNTLTRAQADALVSGVKPNGRVIYADAGEANFVGEALLLKLALSVVEGVIVEGIKAATVAAWTRWVRRPASEVAKDLDPPTDPAELEIYINTVIYVQQNRIDEIAERLVAEGRPAGAA